MKWFLSILFFLTSCFVAFAQSPQMTVRESDGSQKPLRIEQVAEVAYDHLQGDRFRHATHFKRWRPDKPASECRYDQLEVSVPFELAGIFGGPSGMVIKPQPVAPPEKPARAARASKKKSEPG